MHRCMDGWMFIVYHPCRACVRLCPSACSIRLLTVNGQSRAVVKNAQGREKVLLTRMGAGGMVPGEQTRQTDRQTTNKPHQTTKRKRTGIELIGGLETDQPPSPLPSPPHPFWTAVLGFQER